VAQKEAKVEARQRLDEDKDPGLVGQIQAEERSSLNEDRLKRYSQGYTGPIIIRTENNIVQARRSPDPDRMSSRRASSRRMSTASSQQPEPDFSRWPGTYVAPGTFVSPVDKQTKKIGNQEAWERYRDRFKKLWVLIHARLCKHPKEETA
jgi:hypothetical protein